MRKGNGSEYGGNTTQKGGQGECEVRKDVIDGSSTRRLSPIQAVPGKLAKQVHFSDTHSL